MYSGARALRAWPCRRRARGSQEGTRGRRCEQWLVFIPCSQLTGTPVRTVSACQFPVNEQKRQQARGAGPCVFISDCHCVCSRKRLWGSHTHTRKKPRDLPITADRSGARFGPVGRTEALLLGVGKPLHFLGVLRPLNPANGSFPVMAFQADCASPLTFSQQCRTEAQICAGPTAEPPYRGHSASEDFLLSSSCPFFRH